MNLRYNDLKEKNFFLQWEDGLFQVFKEIVVQVVVEYC